MNTLPAFLDWARATPAKANYGSPGSGTPPRFVEQLRAVQRENADWGPIVKTIGFSADN